MKTSHAFATLALGAAAMAAAACGSSNNGTGSNNGTTSATAASSGNGPASGTTAASASSAASSGAGGSLSGPIPDPGPGDGFDNNVGSIEPNDTPQQATPLGTAKGPNYYTWVNSNTIGGGDDADYFVFRSSAAGEFQLGAAGLCGGPPLTKLSGSLWKVANSQPVQPPIHTWSDSGLCLKSAMGDAPIEANTVYLFGVFAEGGKGQYAA